MESHFQVIIDLKKVDETFPTIDAALQYLEDNGYEATNTLSAVYETPTSWEYYSTRRNPQGRLVEVSITNK